MAARAGGGRRRHLYRGIESRRIFRPLRSGPARRSHRLARRLLDACGRVVGRRRHARAVATPGEGLRSLAGALCFGAADAAASQRPAASRHLRHRLRRAVQLHRGVHLRELPSRRSALPLFLDAARRDFLTWIGGAVLMLAPPIPAIIAGLMFCAGCGMLCQTISTGYVTEIAKEGRSSAVGLYVTSFYVGGSMGAFLPGLAWEWGGWPATIAMVVAMLAAMAVIAALAYRDATA